MAVDWILKIQTQCPENVKSPNSAVLLGLKNNDFKYSPLEDFKPFFDEG